MGFWGFTAQDRLNTLLSSGFEEIEFKDSFNYLTTGHLTIFLSKRKWALTHQVTILNESDGFCSEKSASHYGRVKPYLKSPHCILTTCMAYI